MGSGKSTWAINEMNQNIDKSYVYITPLLSEIERIKSFSKSDFYDPQNFGCGKLDSFNRLLSGGRNIASSHSLFTRINDDTKALISQGKYILILDEALDVISPYKGLKEGDIKFLIEKNIISIENDTGYVVWNESEKYCDFKYEEFMLLAQNRSLLYINKILMLWHFPPDVFSLFEKVYILTYLFEGQVMKYYFDFFGIIYNMMQVIKTNDTYTLCSYAPENEDRERMKSLINICMDEKLNDIGTKHSALSDNWYKTSKDSSGNYPQIKNNLKNYFTNKTKAQSNTIMWTCFKDYRFKIEGKGYTYALPKNSIPTNPTDDDKKRAACYVSSNCRATNMYSERYNLAYTINKFVNPYIAKYFLRKGVVFNEDAYALSELLQWIWRSRIRNGEPINLYLPSKRMRDLLFLWLNKSDIRNDFRKSAS